MIRNIVFDMGQVLVDYNAERFAAVYLDNPEDSALIARELFGSVEWVRMDRGSLTEEEALRGICARLPERLRETAKTVLNSWHDCLTEHPGMEEFCGRVKNSGYKVYLLSNAAFSFYRYRHRIGALKHFDGEFVSADWNLLKPDIEIYRAFFNHFSLVPSQCLFIDDLPVNIEGAGRAGMRGVVYRGDIAALEQALKRNGIELK